LQTWEWGEFRKSMGIDVMRLVMEEKKHITQCWQVTFHSIPFTPFTVGYFPKGQIPNQRMLDELMKWGKKKRALYIQLEPNMETKRLGDKEIVKTDSFLNLSVSQYPNLTLSHHPLFTKYTFILDLTKSEEDLLKEMHNKTRYNIRLAQKHGVLIKEDSSDEAFSSYLKLSEETTSRQGFFAHNQTYHRAMWKTLKKNNIARLFTASYNNEILTTWILFCLHDTIYYPYGASSRDHREVMAPNLMLWELMKWGKAHGYKKFDLWGAMGPSPTGEPDKNDPWYGFHHFKEGYHPELVEFAGSYDLIINPVLYKLYCLTDTIRWTVLKLKVKLFNF